MPKPTVPRLHRVSRQTRQYSPASAGGKPQLTVVLLCEEGSGRGREELPQFRNLPYDVDRTQSGLENHKQEPLSARTTKTLKETRWR